MKLCRFLVWGVLAVGISGCDDTGDSCNTNDDCSSGVCEGKGCGADQGVCAAKDPDCNDDDVPYCGCDGQTFYGSGNCPGGRYERSGTCE